MANCGVEQKESINNYDKGVDIKCLALRCNLDKVCNEVKEAKRWEKVYAKYVQTWTNTNKQSQVVMP